MPLKRVILEMGTVSAELADGVQRLDLPNGQQSADIIRGPAEPLRKRQLAFGYTQDDMKVILAPLARNAERDRFALQPPRREGGIERQEPCHCMPPARGIHKALAQDHVAAAFAVDQGAPLAGAA